MRQLPIATAILLFSFLCGIFAQPQVEFVQWAWISGNNTGEKPGIYGEKGKASTANIPGSRQGALGWYDSSTQELWLFGGSGFATKSTQIGTYS